MDLAAGEAPNALHQLRCFVESSWTWRQTDEAHEWAGYLCIFQIQPGCSMICWTFRKGMIALIRSRRLISGVLIEYSFGYPGTIHSLIAFFGYAKTWGRCRWKYGSALLFPVQDSPVLTPPVATWYRRLWIVSHA
jgi:hypothetical protein